MKVHSELLAHGTQTGKDIVCLSPGIWTAVGFAASNVHMIEGNATTTIVDTSESTRAAANIRQEFQKLTDKPVGRIVYTHPIGTIIRARRYFRVKPYRSTRATCSSRT